MNRTLLLLVVATACGRSGTIGTPPPPQPLAQPLAGCSGKAMVLLEGGRTLTRLEADGTARALFTFGEGLADEQVYVSSWQVAGGFVAGVALAGDATQAALPFEYVLLDAQGTVLLHRGAVQRYSPQIFLADDGSLAVAADTGWVARADGSVTELGLLRPQLAALPGGELVVANGEPTDASAPRGVWKDGVFTLLSGDTSWGFERVGARAVYLDHDTLVSVTGDRRIALPLSAPRFVRAAGGRWVLLADDTGAALVDLEQGTARKLAQVPPPNERYQVWNLSLQADGAVLGSVERAEQLQLQRSADLGGTWSDLGEPMAMGTDFGLGRWMLPVERSGSVLVMSLSTGYGHYLNEVQLISASGAHRFGTGGLYVNVNLEPGAADLSADGQCLAAWVARGDGAPADLTVMDGEGRQRVVRTSAEPGWLRFLP